MFALPPVFFVSIKGNKVNPPPGQATRPTRARERASGAWPWNRVGLGLSRLLRDCISPPREDWGLSVGPVYCDGLDRDSHAALSYRKGVGETSHGNSHVIFTSMAGQGSLAPGPCPRLPSATSSSFPRDAWIMRASLPSLHPTRKNPPPSPLPPKRAFDQSVQPGSFVQDASFARGGGSAQWKCKRMMEKSMFCRTCSMTATLVGSSSGHTARSSLPSTLALTPKQ